MTSRAGPAPRVPTNHRAQLLVLRAVVVVAGLAVASPAASQDSTPRPGVGPPHSGEAAAHRDSTPGDTASGAPARNDSASHTAPRGPVRLCAGGDVTLGTDLDTSWTRRLAAADPTATLPSPAALVAPLRPLVHGADIVLLNAESAIGDGSVDDAKCTPPRKFCYALRAPPAAAAALRAVADSGAIVVANVANNHVHDAGAAGFLTTLAWLDSAGVMVTGADTEPTLAITAAGDTIAMLGFSAWSDPGVLDLEAVQRLVARAVARYGRVVVTAHLGAEGRDAQRTVDSLEHFVGEDRGNPVAFAHAAVDAGAVLVVGHGPHVLRAAEWRNGGGALILYSMGNLINYGPFGLREPMDRGAIVCATLDSAGRPSDVRLLSTFQPVPGRVVVDHTRRARVLVDSLSRLDFPNTGAAVDRATGAVTVRARVGKSAAKPGVTPRQRGAGRSPAAAPGPPQSSHPRSSPAAPPATASPLAPGGG